MMKTTDETDNVLSSAALQVAAARIRITEFRPYISHAIFAITTRSLPGLGTIGVDRHWRLVYDPATVVTWTVPVVAWVLYHEVWHLLRDHAGRAAGRDAQVWNLACDAEINDDLRDEMNDDETQGPSAFLLPGHPVLPDSFGMPDGLTAEEYYDRLVKEQSPGSSGASGSAPRRHDQGARRGVASGWCGSAATGVAEP